MALPAAQASLAAHKQGKFWEYHDKIFASYSSLSEAKLETFASELGLNLERFRQDRNSPQVSGQVNNDLRLGSKVGVRGTPTVFINGLLLKDRSLANASNIIEAEIRKAKVK